VDGEEFLKVAQELAEGPREAHQRSAISRAYYAAFHSVCEVLRRNSINIPENPGGHMVAIRCLDYSRDANLAQAGSKLGTLRSSRRHADYTLDRPLGRFQVGLGMGHAEQVIKAVKASSLQSPGSVEAENIRKTLQSLHELP
jgi:uncharacterized protein (UPF0332 family)